MKNSIAGNFTFTSLIKYSAPSIVMMIFMSAYTAVDGFFISRYIGTDALSAVNIVFPLINVVIGISIMLATGGSAEVASYLGRDEVSKARGIFTMIVIVGLSIGSIIAIAGNIFIDDIVRFLGATDSIIGYCRDYLSILLIFTPAYVLQMLFQTFASTAGKPTLGLCITVLAGLTNAVLDYVFMVPLGMGIKGAAYATAAGYMVPAVFGLIYFGINKKGSLYFDRPLFDMKELKMSMANGSSEMVSELSNSVITFLFNFIMLKMAGPDGVAAITIILYVQFLMTAFYMGFAIGVAPVISYNHGSGNIEKLRKTIRICFKFTFMCSIGVFLVSNVLADPIVQMFCQRDSHVFELARRGFTLFSFSYLFSGLNIYSSAMFTALSDGKVSALISFLRTFVFIVAGIMLLPVVFSYDGIFLSVPFAELLTAIVSIMCIRNYRRKVMIM